MFCFLCQNSNKEANIRRQVFSLPSALHKKRVSKRVGRGDKRHRRLWERMKYTCGFWVGSAVKSRISIWSWILNLGSGQWWGPWFLWVWTPDPMGWRLSFPSFPGLGRCCKSERVPSSYESGATGMKANVISFSQWRDEVICEYNLKILAFYGTDTRVPWLRNILELANLFLCFYYCGS